MYIISQNKTGITKMTEAYVKIVDIKYHIIVNDNFVAGTYNSFERCKEIMAQIIKQIKESPKTSHQYDLIESQGAIHTETFNNYYEMPIE